MKTLRVFLLLCGVLGFISFNTAFVHAQAEQECSLSSALLTVKSDDILDCLRNGQSVDLNGVTIKGDLDLTSLQPVDQQNFTLISHLVITNSIFSGNVTAVNWDRGIDNVMFQKKVNFQGSHFEKGANFSSVHFGEYADFSKTEFKGPASYTEATFKNGASFYYAAFNSDASFYNASFENGIDFSEANFENGVDFSLSHFMGEYDALFLKTEFTGLTMFYGSQFDAQALFKGAIFSRQTQDDSVLFLDTTFTKLNLSDAQFENGQLELGDGDYELIMPNFHPSILSLKNDPGIYSFLENNFRAQKNSEIVNEIAYWSYIVKRKNHSSFVQPLETVLLDWTFGYGYKPLNAIVASIILILLFAIGYYPKGTLRPVPLAPSKPRERKFTIRLTEIPIAHDDEAPHPTENNPRIRQLPPQFRQAWQAVLFSAGVFTKISPGNYIATRARSLVIAEWIIGLIMMAGFLYSLANTNPFVRSLLNMLG